MPSKGDVIDGRYRIEHLIGRGGMGEVYAAEHLMLKTSVAVKFLSPEAGGVDAVARFAREAQVAARLSSPHATRVFDVATPEGRSPYLVMELLHGRDLETVLREDGGLSLERATSLVLEACDALAEAHANGIVHRDIKPGNLFLARQSDGTEIIKVLDFGLSKVVDAIMVTSLSSTTAVMGSPGYMSPEQLRSTKRVDARTDIWALGVVLYELLCQRLPFRFESSSELLIAIASDPHVPIREVRPDLPASFERVMDKCLAKRADERYQNIHELAVALAPFAGATSRRLVETIARRSNPQILTPAPSAKRVGPNAAVATTLAAVSSTAGHQKRKRVSFIAAVAGAGLVLLGAGAFALQRMTSRADPTSAIPAAAAEPMASHSVNAKPSAMVEPSAATGAPSTSPAPSALGASSAPSAPSALSVSARPPARTVPVVSPAPPSPKAARPGEPRRPASNVVSPPTAAPSAAPMKLKSLER